MYTVRMKNHGQAVVAARALTAAFATSPYEVTVRCARYHRLPCGTIEVNLDGTARRVRRSATERQRDLVNRRAITKGRRYELQLEGIRRRERGPLRGNLPPEAEAYVTWERRRKNGFALDWEEWLLFNALVNATLDAAVGQEGDVWSVPHFVRKLVIREAGRAVVDYDVDVSPRNAMHGMSLRITPLFE